MRIARRFLFCVRCSRLHRLHHKKYETLTTIPPIHVSIIRINNTLVFKTKN